MAYQNNTLSSAEHDFFATRSGAPANAPLSEHKRTYYRKVLPGSPPVTESLVDLERRWLKWGGAGSSDSIHDLWRAFVGAHNIDATGKTLDQIKFEYYAMNEDP